VYRSSPVQIAGTSWSILGSNMSKETHVIRSDGSMWGFGENNQGQIGIGDTVNRSSPVQVAGTWSAVSGGQAPHVGLKTDGSLFAWGEGTHGRLGLGDTNNRSSPAQISGTWTQISTCGGRVQGAFRL